MTNEAKTARDTTALEFILSKLSSENSTLISTIHDLENIGHKIKNTNFPTPETSVKDPSAKPDGLLEEIGLQLSYYEGHNYRLQELLKKLSPLL